MVRSIVDVFGEGSSWEDLHANTDEERLVTHLEEARDLKFKFRVESMFRKIKPEEALTVMNRYENFPFGDHMVDMKNPQRVYSCFEHPKQSKYYFGLEVAAQIHEHQKQSFFMKYHLRDRPYLGPTSTSHDLAFLMANQAEIKPGSLVIDPFVGTGSILIACSALGAECFGSDIDI